MEMRLDDENVYFASIQEVASLAVFNNLIIEDEVAEMLLRRRRLGRSALRLRALRVTKTLHHLRDSYESIKFHKMTA